MKDYDTSFFYLLATIVASIAVSVPIGVFVHETGHFIGGRMAGYKFTMMSMFGLTVSCFYGRLHFRIERKGPPGQCQMHPVTLKQNGTGLIIGGIVANACVGLTMIVYGVLSCQIYGFIFYTVVGGMNLALAVQNMLPGSVTNDGSTMRDAGASPVNMEIYNRLMIIYMLLEEGSTPLEIPEFLFDAPLLWESALSAELSLYRYMQVKEKYRYERKGRERIRREYCRLMLYSPETCILEAANEC